MVEPPTLEEQIHQAKDDARRIYAERVLKAMQGERTSELNELLINAPVFLKRSAVNLYARIVDDYKSGKPTSPRDVRRAENVVEFTYLAYLNLVEVQEKLYLGLFKRKVIVPREMIEE